MNLKIVDLQTNDLRKYGSWSQCARKKGCRLPMNRKMPPLQMNKLRILGSWSQCMRKKTERGLSMNRVEKR